MLVLASLVLGFAMFGALSGFGVMWLHSMPMRPCLDVTIWEVSPWCQLLWAHLSPFSLRATIAYHAFLCHPLALCASLHACLHIHAWVLLVSVSPMLQHNKAMDIRSKPIFIPHGHYLLFAILLVYPLLVVAILLVYPFAHMFAHILYAMLVIAILLARFAPFCYYLCISPFPLLVYWFLVFAFACTHGARTHGARERSPRCKQKGHGCKLANMNWAVVFNRFRI